MRNIYKEDFINKINAVLQVTIIIILFMLVSFVYFISKDINLTTVVFCFSALIIAVMFLYEKIQKIYMKNIFIGLSDMLDTIIDMKNERIFSDSEDTLISKLQYKTIKLSNILNNKNKQIENEQNEIKSLISDIAHQLKTPLTNLKMYEEFLKDESLTTEEKEEFNDVIMLSLERLMFLVESMIKMSRLEYGVINLRKKNNNLNETVLDVIGQIEKNCKNKNIEIKYEEIDKINISYDRNWICEAILNILDNAVKYTPKNGQILVKVEKYEIFSRVDIKDNGIGIEEEELPKIFSRFYRGKNTLDAEGIGIGLYLSREIVNKHGGYIKVSSSKKGSTFSIFLPNK